MKRIIQWQPYLLGGILCLAALRGGSAQGAPPKTPARTPIPPAIRATAAIVVEASTGATLLAKNPDKRLPPASTTKIMTALLLVRSVPPSQLIVTSPAAASIPGNALGMKPGEAFTARDLLYAILLASANDASVAAAEHIAGTTAQFVSRMNAEAQAMGATNTHFANPHGLQNPDHYSTARDLAAIARQAMRNPVFAAAAHTRTYSVPRRSNRPPTLLTNKDDLLWTIPGADGVKTGWTRAAGYCFVGSAIRGGRRIITVVLNSPDWQAESAALLRYGFACSPTGSEAGKASSTPSNNVAGSRLPLAGHAPPTARPLTPEAHGAVPYTADPTPDEDVPDALARPASGYGAPGTASAPLFAPSETRHPLSGPNRRLGQTGTLPGHAANPAHPVYPTPAWPSAHPIPETAIPAGTQETLKQGRDGREEGRENPKSSFSAGSQENKKPGIIQNPKSKIQNPAVGHRPRFPWLWLLLLLFLLACWLLRRRARSWRFAMPMPKFALPFLRRPARRSTPDVQCSPLDPASPAPSAQPPPPAAPPTFNFIAPPITRCSGREWLEMILKTPDRLLEPLVRRHARALLEADPHACEEKVTALLSDPKPKMRVIAADLLAAHTPRRAEETLLAVVEDERTPSDVRAEAVAQLARQAGDRQETLWTQMLLRESYLPAAAALAALPRLSDTTCQMLRQPLTVQRPASKDAGAALRDNLLTAQIACVLGAHGHLPAEEATSHLERLPANHREQTIVTALSGVSSAWAIERLVETVLYGRAYPALQGLLDSDPAMVRTILDARWESLDAPARTRATVLKWMLLGEGDTDTVRQLAEAGDDFAGNALALGAITHWDPLRTPPDALQAAALLLSLRLGYAPYTQEQITAVFRTAATDEEMRALRIQTPELEPLAQAYKRPEVYDAVQAALSTEDGLSAQLAGLARWPENKPYQAEMVFWSDKTSHETRLFLTNALSVGEDPSVRAAMAARAADPCSMVRAAALRSLAARPYQGRTAVSEPTGQIDPILPAADDAPPSVPPIARAA